MVKLPTQKHAWGWSDSKGTIYKGVDIFCAKCLTHDRFFTGGGSWSPDLCPCGCQDTTVWHKMGPFRRRKAQKKYDKDLEIWQKKIST